MTDKQIVSLVVTVFVLLIVICLLKKIVRVVVSIAVIVCALIYFWLVSPSQIKDVSSLAKGNLEVVTQLSSLATSSENIKLDTSDGVSVQVKIGDNWIDTKDISNIVSLSDNSVTMTVDGKEQTVEDSSVAQLMTILKK